MVNEFVLKRGEVYLSCENKMIIINIKLSWHKTLKKTAASTMNQTMGADDIK